MPSRTDAFGCVPLNGAANACMVRPLVGSGLSSASRTSGVRMSLAAFFGGSAFFGVM
jgi:hypothetical protein